MHCGEKNGTSLNNRKFGEEVVRWKEDERNPTELHGSRLLRSERDYFAGSMQVQISVLHFKNAGLTTHKIIGKYTPSPIPFNEASICSPVNFGSPQSEALKVQ